jgi:anti-sigma-K factor RskA
MDELHDLAPLYALDALDPAEAAAFVAHLRGCAACRDEVRALSGGVEALAQAVSEPAPSGLRSSVMERIDAERATLAPVVPMRRPRRWKVIAAIAAAAAIVNGVLLVGALGRLSDADRALEVVSAGDARTVALADTPVGPVRFVWSGDVGRGVFTGSAVPAIQSNRTYELWYMDAAGNPTPAGLFAPDAAGDVLVLVDMPVEPGTVLGLTVEPSGGSPAPTGDVLIAEPLS